MNVIAVITFVIGAILGFSMRSKEETYTIDELKQAMQKAIPTLFGRHRPYDYDRVIGLIIEELKRNAKKS